LARFGLASFFSASRRRRRSESHTIVHRSTMACRADCRRRHHDIFSIFKPPSANRTADTIIIISTMPDANIFGTVLVNRKTNARPKGEFALSQCQILSLFSMQADARNVHCHVNDI
jgi:hypothetical protein